MAWRLELRFIKDRLANPPGICSTFIGLEIERILTLTRSPIPRSSYHNNNDPSQLLPVFQGLKPWVDNNPSQLSPGVRPSFNGLKNHLSTIYPLVLTQTLPTPLSQNCSTLTSSTSGDSQSRRSSAHHNPRRLIPANKPSVFPQNSQS